MKKNFDIIRSSGNSLFEEDVYRILKFKNTRDLIFFLEKIEQKIEKEHLKSSFMGLDIAEHTVTFLTEPFIEHIESQI